MTSFFPATQRGFIRQAELVRDLVTANGIDKRATRLEWRLDELVNHFVAGMRRLWEWRIPEPADRVPVDEVSYWAGSNRRAADVARAARRPAPVPELLTDLIDTTATAIDVVTAAAGNEPIGAPDGEWLTLDAFCQTRILELTVHGFDLQAAYGLALAADETALSITAVILDRRLDAPRPADLSDPVRWIEAACGRIPHPDRRLPLIG